MHAHGIIPAYAGSTHQPCVVRSAERDHPRIRGEHDLYALLSASTWGSSPHTRGAHFALLFEVDGDGIIPAYAGSTQTGYAVALPRRDHPRIRGEHVSSTHVPPQWAGSSPHTRGAPILILRRRGFDRIIPAYAGSTLAEVVGGHSDGDHPRIRGEHRFPCASVSDVSGSSPHTRGAPRRHVTHLLSQGIIPAYAGSTRRALSAR